MTLAAFTASTHVEISRDGRILGVVTWEEYGRLDAATLAGCVTRPLTRAEAEAATARQMGRVN